MSYTWSVEPLSPTVDSTLDLLQQTRTFLAQLQDDAYRTPSPLIGGSTIGGHVRHALDHFNAALSALEGDVIDYDHRQRDTDVERSAHAALALIEDLFRRLEKVREGDLSWPVRVRVIIRPDGTDALLGSTMARELAFATHHAIHHHAMIAAIAKHMALDVPADFGKAPSTVCHERDIDDARAKSAHA